MLKFCANLTFMFKSSEPIERYALARDLGFKGVESADPYLCSIEEILAVKKKCELQQVLINTPNGSLDDEIGFAALLNRSEKFSQSFSTAIEYAKALDCKNIHIMSGKVPIVTYENHEMYFKNLKEVSPILEEVGIVGLIEPINSHSVSNYYLNSYKNAIEILKKINSPNLKLLVDIYHLQRIQGNLTTSIIEMFPYIGHIQISQVPDRNEPCAQGEIDYKYIFNLLQNLNYKGWIGLEYKPSFQDFTWLRDFGITS